MLTNATGHQTYQKGTKTWNDVISTFGRDVLKEDGEIDRRALGGKVFADKVCCNCLPANRAFVNQLMF